VTDAVSMLRQEGTAGAARALVLPVAIVAIIVMMVLPIPPLLLDIFFVVNIVVALAVLLVSINTFRPLEFSSFPTVLLFATMLRLALNIASTRVVLVEGHKGTDAAGKVIESFGHFVIGGNYVVGFIVFIVLIIINMVVIVKGTGRVSEVSARFTLDAMPGKQMAIDADLNAGLITPEQAKQRRAEVTQESDFYGSMDGATKFVKGDAVAGLLIVGINIFGGLIIGMAQHGLGFSQAAKTYLTLTIGDGLVAQIPALLLSIAAAVIVTRDSGGNDLTEQVLRQIGNRKAWYAVAAILALIGVVPGMPNLFFLAAAALAFAFAHYGTASSSGAKDGEDAADAATDDDASKDEDRLTVDDVSNSTPLLLEVGYGLIPLIEDEGKSALVARITGIRKNVSRDVGFIVPPVRIRDNLAFQPSTYRITVAGVVLAEDMVIPGKLLAIQSGRSNLVIPGEQVKDPTFGFDAVWIDPSEKSRALAADYTVVDPSTVIATHMHHLLGLHAADLLGQDDVQLLLDHVAKSAPHLVSGLVPKSLSLSQLTHVLKSLVAEQVPITDLRRILEALAGSKSREADEMVDICRIALAPMIVQRVSSPKEPLSVITLDSGLEQLIIQNGRQGSGFTIEPGLARKLVESFQEQSTALAEQGKTLVVVTAPILRRELAALVRQGVPDGLVLSVREIPENKRINVVAVIGGTA
jgi:flagellar biosynthesis protein FlhA